MIQLIIAQNEIEGYGISCSSCGEYTDTDGLCHNCDLQHTQKGEANPLCAFKREGKLTEKWIDIVPQNVEAILSQENTKRFLGEIEYAPSKTLDVYVLERIDKKNTSAITIQIGSQKYKFHTSKQGEIQGFKSLQGTKKSHFTKKVWRQYKPSAQLVSFLKEKCS